MFCEQSSYRSYFNMSTVLGLFGVVLGGPVGVRLGILAVLERSWGDSWPSGRFLTCSNFVRFSGLPGMRAPGSAIVKGKGRVLLHEVVSQPVDS